MDMMLLGGPPLLSGRLSGQSFESEDTGFVLVPFRSACVLLPVTREVDACTDCLCRVHPLGVSCLPHSIDSVALCCRLNRHHPGHMSLAIGLG
jgi:hypothetical protein